MGRHIARNAQNIQIVIQKYRVTLLVIVIFIVAAILRFYNFYEGWGVGGDSARDISIAREAIERREIPLIGPFSSAGPFVTGPMY